MPLYIFCSCLVQVINRGILLLIIDKDKNLVDWYSSYLISRKDKIQAKQGNFTLPEM